MKPLILPFRLTVRLRPYICSSCISRQSRSTPRRARPYSTPVTNSSYPSSSSYAHLTSRRLISLRGPDAAHFLQGMITSNISTTVPRTTGFYSAFLNATGRVLYDIFIYPDINAEGRKDGQSWLVEVDTNEAERLFKHIKRFKLRAKFALRLLDVEERKVWSVWRDEAGDGWTKHSLGDANAQPLGYAEIGCADVRAPGMGHRVILGDGAQPGADGPGSTEEAYQIRRYVKGVAEGQGEIVREVALPQESNIDFMGGIDYRKGCYVGQELTIRTHHTGVIRKRILPVMLYDEGEASGEGIPRSMQYLPGVKLEMPPRDTSIGRLEKKGRSAGKFLAGTGNVGLALCRLEIMTDTVVSGDMAGYKEGDEFKLAWEGEDGTGKSVRIKAFVPPWHLRK